MRGQWRVLSAVAALAFVACKRQPPSGATRTTPPAADSAARAIDRSPSAPTAWESLMARVPESGVVSRDVALQAWAMTVGPIPGATAPQDDGSAPPCGYSSMLWVLSHWDTLSAEQRQAVEARFRGERPRATREWRADEAMAASIPGFTFDPAQCTLAQSPPWTDAEKAQLRQMVQGLIAEITARTGQPFRDQIEYRFVDRRYLGGPRDGACGATPAQAFVTSATNNLSRFINSFSSLASETTCAVEFGKLVIEEPALARALVAHELVHCFQHDVFEGTVLDWTQRNQLANGDSSAQQPINPVSRSRQWIIEGSAAWIGEEIAGGSEFSRYWWRSYLQGWHVAPPGTSRLSRAEYNAIGFYAHLHSRGAPVWGRIFEGVSGSSREFYDSLTRSAPDGRHALATLTSSAFNNSAWGPSWTQAGSRVPNDHREAAPQRDLGAGHVADFDAEPMTQVARRYSFGPNVSLVRIIGEGHATVSFDGRGERIGEGSWTWEYCLGGNGCRCPNGTPIPGTSADAVAVPRAELTVTGAGATWDPTRLRISAYNACNEPLPPQGALERIVPPEVSGQDRCLVGRWRLDTRASTVFDTLRATSGIRYSGTINLDVTEQRASARPEGFQAMFTNPSPGVGGEIRTLILARGETSASWRARAGTAEFAGVVNGLAFNTETRMGAMRFPLSIRPDQMPQFLNSRVRYECSPRRLVFFYSSGTRAVYLPR
jgi:hypothetical protein